MEFSFDGLILLLDAIMCTKVCAWQLRAKLLLFNLAIFEIR